MSYLKSKNNNKWVRNLRVKKNFYLQIEEHFDSPVLWLILAK
ncbi:hypothetical protein GvMRE_IIg79 [endosymbiont GvMRE of Glomus versiforme]|nr:hypothetical protein GvMRE_IIg79 [endosymbiont GvMRE of Glomus versiforme]